MSRTQPPEVDKGDFRLNSRSQWTYLLYYHLWRVDRI